MPTMYNPIGIVAVEIVEPDAFCPLIDIIIQNLSANNIYIGSDQTVTDVTGILIAPNGTWVNDKRAEPIWLIASGAGSDVRIQYSKYKPGDR